MNQNPPPLDYATRIGEYPDPKAHSELAVFLIGTSALAGVWSIILGICYALDLKIYAALLLAAGVGLCWATFRYLPAGRPRWRPALILLTFVLACEVAVVVLGNRDYQLQYALYGSALPTNPRIRQMASTEEKEVFSFEMIRNGAGATAAVVAMLWLYVAVKAR